MSKSQYYKELKIECENASNLDTPRIWFTAKNPLPLQLLKGDGETSTYNLDYEQIDDLFMMVMLIPLNIATYRMFHIAAFLPVRLIRECMPELSINGANSPFLNKLYYRFDGKNANGKLSASFLPMGGGGYGSIETTTVASRINAAWLLNYGSDIPESATDAYSYCAGWRYQNGVFTDIGASVGVIQDDVLPSGVLTNVQIIQRKDEFLEHLAKTYGLEWWEMAMQTKFCRVKDSAMKQKILDNLLLSFEVTSQVSYNSILRLWHFSPHIHSVCPFNTGTAAGYRAWCARIGYSQDSSNWFGFAGKLPAFVHCKYTSSNFLNTTIAQSTKYRLTFEDGFQQTINYKPGFVARDVIYKYMSNVNTGWTCYHADTNPTLGKEYVLRAPYSKKFQCVTGDIDFKSTITCADSIAMKSMVNLQVARKSMSEIHILNLEFPGVIL